MGDDFTRRVEIVYQRYFAEHERLWEETPRELDALPRGESLLLEMVIDEWFRARRKALAPLEYLLARLEEGVDPDSELGQALAEAAAEFGKDPEGFRGTLERYLDEAEIDAGDLGYAVGISRCGAALEAGQQTRASGFLNRVTGRDWATRAARSCRRLGRCSLKVRTEEHGPETSELLSPRRFRTRSRNTWMIGRP
jgi:hypothetical protein